MINVLMVDEVSSIKAVKEFLTSKSSTNVNIKYSCSDGLEAIKLIKDKYDDFDCIVLSMVLPSLAGMGILKFLKRENLNKKVILYTYNKNILLEKIDKTESNSKLIIKLIKVLGITLGILIFILLCISGIYFSTINYYKSEVTASGEGRVCYFNGKISNYIIMKNTDNTLTFEIEDEIIKDKFNLDNIKTGEPKEILDKIVIYIKENGGVCLEEK